MTTLSTHDTKRSRTSGPGSAVLSELPARGSEAVRAGARLSAATTGSRCWTASTEYLLWQTLVGTWATARSPRTGCTAYLEKATREAKRHTTWTAPDEEYEEAVARLCAPRSLADPDVTGVGTALRRTGSPSSSGRPRARPEAGAADHARRAGRLPGHRARRPVARRPGQPPAGRLPAPVDRLAAARRGAKPDDLADEKLLVTSRALRIRRKYPDAFAGAYTPLPTSNGHAVAFARGDTVITVATRLPAALYRLGGWGESTVVLPSGEWTNVLTGRVVGRGAARIHELLEDLPVALLVRS